MRVSGSTSRGLAALPRRRGLPSERGPPQMSRDADARRKIAEHLDTTLFVEAAAGTGKTTALVGRIVALLRSGRAALDGVVALTFADKAAGEMRLRLRAELEVARTASAAGSDERDRLDAALEQLELARIATIHAFCGDLLQERPVEAGVDPMFAIAAPDEAARLLERASTIGSGRARRSARGVRRLLRRRPRGPTRSARALRGALARRAPRLHRALAPRPVRARARRRDPRARGSPLAERAADGDWLPRNPPRTFSFVAENRLRGGPRARLRRARGGAARPREDPQDRLATWAQPARYGEGLLRAEVLARRVAKRHLDLLLADCDADLAACLKPELPVVAKYENKRAAGVLDFVDLLVARAISWCATRRCAPTSCAASRTTSSTSSRTPIRSRPRS